MDLGTFVVHSVSWFPSWFPKVQMLKMLDILKKAIPPGMRGREQLNQMQHVSFLWHGKTLLCLSCCVNSGTLRSLKHAMQWAES